jgi:hypothetical protein
MDFSKAVSEIDVQISQLQHARNILVGLDSVDGSAPTRIGRRTMSAAARARIATAQRARWAKVKAGKSSTPPAAKATGKRIMSAAARRKIAAAQRARWAKVKFGRKAA